MENQLVSMAQQFSGLPIESLIATPLNAAATANAAMATTQTKFMLDTCFSKASDTDPYKPIMVDMELTRGVLTPGAKAGDPASIQQVKTKFQLPILTIVPLNSLAVKTAEVNFEMEVQSSYSEDLSETKETELKAEASFEAKVGYGPFTASVKGSVSYDQKDSSTHDTHYSKSNSAKYAINVTAGQLPLPQGVTTIIKAFTQSIEPIQMPTAGGPSNK